MKHEHHVINLSLRERDMIQTVRVMAGEEYTPVIASHAIRRYFHNEFHALSAPRVDFPLGDRFTIAFASASRGVVS